MQSGGGLWIKFSSPYKSFLSAVNIYYKHHLYYRHKIS